jgi:hypothetical protein
MPGDAGGDGAALRREWARWTKVVGGYCRRGWRRAAAEPAAYAELYAKLLAACRAAAAAVPDGPQHDFYESLADLVRPWVSADVLGRTDREILVHLWVRCQEADCRLRGVRPEGGRTWALERLLFPLLLVALAGVALGLDEATALFGGRARSASMAVWYTVRGLNTGESLVLLGIIVVALALTLVRRDRHR